MDKELGNIVGGAVVAGVGLAVLDRVYGRGRKKKTSKGSIVTIQTPTGFKGRKVRY